MKFEKGFAQVLVIGIVVALMAVGIGSYLYVSKQPVRNEAGALNPAFVIQLYPRGIL